MIILPYLSALEIKSLCIKCHTDSSLYLFYSISKSLNLLYMLSTQPEMFSMSAGSYWWTRPVMIVSGFKVSSRLTVRFQRTHVGHVFLVCNKGRIKVYDGHSKSS